MSAADQGVSFPIARNSVAVRVSEEELAFRFGFHRRGHIEPVTPTAEQIEQHRRAGELLAEMERNPYISIDGYDADIKVTDLETERWVPDESHEQWMARFRAFREANPDAQPKPDMFRDVMAHAFTRALDRSILAGLDEDGAR